MRARSGCESDLDPLLCRSRTPRSSFPKNAPLSNRMNGFFFKDRCFACSDSLQIPRICIFRGFGYSESLHPTPYIIHPTSYILHATSYILHRTSYILHSTSYTLHPTSYILHPASYTLHPTSYTLHPTSYILHPTPYILHPTPYTLHPTPYILLSVALQQRQTRDQGSAS